MNQIPLRFSPDALDSPPTPSYKEAAVSPATREGMSQKDLFKDFQIPDNVHSQLAQLVKDQKTVKRLNSMLKKIENRIDYNEKYLLDNFKVNGTFVTNSFVVTVESKKPDCRPKWKEEFMALATQLRLNPELEINKVIAKVSATLKTYRKLTVKKLS